jgi:hypothetical protein
MLKSKPRPQYTGLVYNRSTRFAPPISDRSRLIPELESSDREQLLRGDQLGPVNVTSGSISRIRRDDLNDRDVSTGNTWQSVLNALYVASAVVARRVSAVHVRPNPDIRGLEPNHLRE